uniref:Unc 50 log n=1 Tax=Rhipicephalus zambeziensis TaxID=60191 RepID=A0A224Z3B1_9ACAR
MTLYAYVRPPWRSVVQQVQCIGSVCLLACAGGNVLSEARPIIMDRMGGLSTGVRSSPLPSPTPNHLEKRSAKDKGSKFLRRLIHVRHMDFQFAMWQMLYLFVSPQKVYRNFQYRKQTKDQFARDDPAFLVLLGLWLVASSVGFVLILRISFLGFLKFLLWVIFIDCIGMGVVVATALWAISNKYLLKPTCRTEDVEWGYAFDVHLNAFFPPLVVLHVFQLFFSRLLSHHISLLFGNTLWLIALGYYIYITFLGYSALPILKNTHIFLYPLALLFVCYIVTLVCNVNLCEALNDFYAYRVM